MSIESWVEQNIKLAYWRQARSILERARGPEDFARVVGRIQISNAIGPRRKWGAHWGRRKHRWEFPMGEGAEAFPLGTESQRCPVILRATNAIA